MHKRVKKEFGETLVSIERLEYQRIEEPLPTTKKSRTADDDTDSLQNLL